MTSVLVTGPETARAWGAGRGVATAPNGGDEEDMTLADMRSGAHALLTASGERQGADKVVMGLGELLDEWEDVEGYCREMISIRNAVDNGEASVIEMKVWATAS